MILTVFVTDHIWDGKNKSLTIQERKPRRLTWYQGKSSKAGVCSALNLPKCSERIFYSLDLCFLRISHCYDLSEKPWCLKVTNP